MNHSNGEEIMRTKFQRCFLFWLVGLVGFVFVTPLMGFAKDDFRSWADASGKNKIKAKFVKLDENLVTLEKEDGEEVEIELKKLSAADQKFVAEAVKEAEDSPFKSKGDDPFKSKSKTKKPKGAKEPKDSDDESDGLRTVKVDLSSADHITLGSPGEAWQVEIPAGEVRPATGKPKPISIPSKTNFFEGLKGLAFNHGAKRSAVVGFLLDKDSGVTRIALCDLSTGKCGTPSVSTGKMTPVALHDDGRQVVMRREEFGFGKQDRLEIWTPKGTKVSKSVAWVPYDAEQGGSRDVMWAEFLDAERLATSSRGGKVVIWKFPEIEPICQFDTADGAVPALSPDRKLIAYSNGSDVGLFDANKQEVIAQQATPIKLQWPYMAFSPSASRLACVAFDKVLVWDVATGNLERTIPCTGIHVHGGIEFPDDNFVLAGNKFLIDIENQLKLWTYDGAEQVRSFDGITYFAVTDGEKKPGALIPAQIPHPAAKDLLKKAMNDPNLFVLKAGTSVRIDVNGIPDATQRERVTQGLAKQLEAVDCKGGATGTIDIVATVEGPKQIELRYRGIGDYKFQETITRVKFIYQNQPVWESSSSNAPFFAQLKRGENMESYLREREKPNYEFFNQVQLPKFLQKPAAGGQGAGNSLTLGQSRITASGIR
jgi:WD40 repeat protein